MNAQQLEYPRHNNNNRARSRYTVIEREEYEFKNFFAVQS